MKHNLFLTLFLTSPEREEQLKFSLNVQNQVVTAVSNGTVYTLPD